MLTVIYTDASFYEIDFTDKRAKVYNQLFAQMFFKRTSMSNSIIFLLLNIVQQKVYYSFLFETRMLLMAFMFLR